MAPVTPGTTSSSRRRTATGRPRGRPRGSTNKPRAAGGGAAGALTPSAGGGGGATPASAAPALGGASGSAFAAAATPAPAGSATEPPPKRRRYIPGGAGGGGRWLDADGRITTRPPNVPRSRPRVTVPTGSSSSRAAGAASAGPSASASLTPYPRRERSTRMRTSVSRYDDDADELAGAGGGGGSELQFGSAAAVAAAVAQNEGYKPREERGWEEFHPSLDIESTFMVFHAEDVDGTASARAAVAAAAAAAAATAATTASVPGTPGVIAASATMAGTPVNGTSTPSKDPHLSSTGNTPVPTAAVTLPSVLFASTPPKRRPGRPPRDPVAYYAALGTTPKTPRVLPIHNQTPKERLELKLPSFHKTDRILLFESKTFGQARYVDKSMMNAGYQESDNFIRPDRMLIKANDSLADDDLEPVPAAKAEFDGVPHTGSIGRVEYDMDEQDDMWLESYNSQRKSSGLETVTREIFEITMTKIEKEWHGLEKRIPKPNPKPPQTHRPRSSSAAAVNGEPQAGEEQDSKCAICDDGDCENTNAIVFCDGCDLAVHQECYGVPFIPEGQWLCRKCQLIGRGIPTCIFCPNTDGAFKQTNSSKWAHLLCAMWIPEVSLGNHTFMEPVMDVEKVPKNRWKLSCYICHQRMGACIQCGNKACYQAFHVTCARRARLYLKMKNSHGALAVLDGNTILKAFCDKHCPADYAKENSVSQATKAAKKFYRRRMRGRIWADSQASALAIAATHRHAMTEHPPDESQVQGAKLTAVLGDKKKGQPVRNVWKLPSGAPVIPQAVFEVVDASMQRFGFRKKRDYIAEACRYWTLKREARRGAALLKRLQLQMETFSSMELTRRNFASIGPSGKARLTRRIDFAKTLIRDLEQLNVLSQEIVERERLKLEQAETEVDFVDTCYFPISRLLLPVVEKAVSQVTTMRLFLFQSCTLTDIASRLDKNVFSDGLTQLQAKVDGRYYTTTLAFAHDLCEVINVAINAEPKAPPVTQPRFELMEASPTKQTYTEQRDRKRLGKRIIKAVQQQLEQALQAETDIRRKPLNDAIKELEGMLEASLEIQQATITVLRPGEAGADGDQDVIMVDAHLGPAGQITVAGEDATSVAVNGLKVGDNDEEEVDEDAMDLVDDGAARSSIDVGAAQLARPVNGMLSSSSSVHGHDSDATAAAAQAAAGAAATVASSSSVNGTGLGIIKPSNTPPSVNGYLPPAVGPTGAALRALTGSTAVTASDTGLAVTAIPVGQQSNGSSLATTGPPTPPQSNGSVGGGSVSVSLQQLHHGHGAAGDGGGGGTTLSGPGGVGVAAAWPSSAPADPLTEGGVAWYLAGFEPEGTTAVEEQWPAGRDAVARALSDGDDELTDIDDEELKGLGRDVGAPMPAAKEPKVEEGSEAERGDEAVAEEGDGEDEVDDDGDDGDDSVNATPTTNGTATNGTGGSKDVTEKGSPSTPSKVVNRYPSRNKKKGRKAGRWR